MMGGSSIAQGRGGPQSQVPPQPNLRNQVPPPILPSQVAHTRIRLKNNVDIKANVKHYISCLFGPNVAFECRCTVNIFRTTSSDHSCLHAGSSIPVEVPWRQWRSEPSVWPPAGGCAQATLAVQPAESA